MTDMKYIKLRIKGFTILEVIIALMISSIGIGLIYMTLYPIHRNLINESGIKERIQWEKCISTIGSENNKFYFVKNKNHHFPIRLYNNIQHKTYEMHITAKKALILRSTDHEGFMPLILNCIGYRFSYNEPILNFEIELRNHHHYHQKIILFEKK